jgi:hypothetical protein
MGKYQGELLWKGGGLAVEGINFTGFDQWCQVEAVSACCAGFTQTIEQVGKGHDRMGKQYPWPGVAHHGLDFFAIYRCVTVHRTFAAGRFVFLERATVEAAAGIGKEFVAIMTECAVGLVVIPAETADHYFDGPGFPLHAF